MTMSAPASRYLKTSSAVSTPVLAARTAAPGRGGSRSRGAAAGFGRRAELEIHGEAQRHDVDVGLVETVEEHQTRGAGFAERARHGADRAEIGTELDRDRQRHRRLHRFQHVDIALFDLIAGHRHIGGNEIDVELDRVGARLLQPAGIVDPAAARDAVEAGDHRNGDGFLGPPDDVEVAFRPDCILGLAAESRSVPRRTRPPSVSVRSSISCRSAMICSSKIEGSTTAAAPASSSAAEIADIGIEGRG